VYHLREHLPTLLTLARDAEKAARVDTLLGPHRGFAKQHARYLEATEERGELGGAV
jgi:hypothetical protein